MQARGVVIHMNHLGAVVRLADGALAAMTPAEVTVHQETLTESLRERKELVFRLTRRGKHAVVSLEPQGAEKHEAPQLTDPVFEERMTTYLKSLEQNETPKSQAQAQRLLFQKKKRTELFSVKKP